MKSILLGCWANDMMNEGALFLSKAEFDAMRPRVADADSDVGTQLAMTKLFVFKTVTSALMAVGEPGEEPLRRFMKLAMQAFDGIDLVNAGEMDIT